MKRSALAVLAPLLLCSLAGCQLETWEGVIDENPATERVFWAGAVVGGVPAMIAASPVTIPLCLTGDSGYSALFLFFPGVPTGLVGGIALGLPVLVLETIVRFPRRLWEHATGASERADPLLLEGPRPEPALTPEPEPKADPPYRSWTEPGPLPQRPY
tara:strand:- start:664 stop:1137 length:474 start_codon:yes stop_codon:yes gene_type:complete